MALVPDQGPVEAFSADGADPAFGDGVRPRGLDRGLDDADVLGGEDVVEAADELGIPVPD